MRFLPSSATLIFLLGTAPVALCDSGGAPANNPDLDKLQAQFKATTKDLVQNMRLVAAYAPQCSMFGGTLAGALDEPIGAIPPGAAKIDTSLTKFKTSVAVIGAAPTIGVDISGGAAGAVRAKQQQIQTAIAVPEAAIDSVKPVVSNGLQQMQQKYSQALGVLNGSSAACVNGTVAFKAMYAQSVTADKQLTAIRAALETQKVALLHWTAGIQTTLGSNQ